MPGKSHQDGEIATPPSGLGPIESLLRQARSPRDCGGLRARRDGGGVGRVEFPHVPSGMVCPDDLPDGLLVADAEARVIVFNRAATRLTGVSAADAIGRDFRDVLPLHDAEGRDWWKCLEPYDGLSTRTRHLEHSLYLAGGPELLVTAAY